MNPVEINPTDLKRLSEFRIEPQVKFPPYRWNELVKESEEKKAHFESWKSTRDFHRWRELRGIAAEEVVSVFTGLPRHKAKTDGGEDFFRTDVKGVPPVRPTLRIEPVNGRGKPIRWIAEYYVAVVVDIYHHWGAVLGWAHRDEIKSARLLKLDQAPALTLYPWELHEGLPPELEEYARLQRAVL